MERTGKVKQAAKLARRLTDPPFAGAAFVLALAAVRGDLFAGRHEFFMLLLFLGILPAPAYILRPTGSGLRHILPFLLTLISYAAAALWAQFAGVGPELQLICRTYFLSVLILTWWNLCIHSNASGHVCGTVGPFVLLVYLTGPQMLWLAIPLAAAVVWASVSLRIHSWKDVILGCLTFGTAFFLALSLAGR